MKMVSRIKKKQQLIISVSIFISLILFVATIIDQKNMEISEKDSK